MSQINATTIFSDFVSANASVVVGNSSSNQTLTANTTRLSFGSNLTINTTSISVGNATVNSTLSSTGLTTNSIVINGVTYSVAPSNTLSYNVFTTTGWSQWTKPVNAGPNDLITIMMWGGGGGGFVAATSAPGGGGACVVVNLNASQVNSVCNVYVASGGAGSVAGGPASAGQTSLFYTNTTFAISAYGGGQGVSGPTAGGGGGWFSVGGTAVGGGPLGGTSGTGQADSTFGGGGANGTIAGRSVYGGGSGRVAGQGGNSIFGGGGGSTTGSFGSSIFGGNGGNNTITPTAPGGGAGNNNSGARGEIRVWVTKVG